MDLPIKPPFPPMEAESAADIPKGANWQYEPKWDGFRCLAFRNGDRIELQSKSGQPLARYFPELVDALKELSARFFVVDGEIVIREGNGFSFDRLLRRLHPAASRIKKLAVDTPSMLIVFDLLVDKTGASLVDLSLRERRQRLEKFAAKNFAGASIIRLSTATTRIGDAMKWLKNAGTALDGIMAKKLDAEYRPGDRSAVRKIKNYRSADCVIGGFRYASGSRVAGSMLLGLYDRDALLHHVGFTSSFQKSERKHLTKTLEALVRQPGFTGRAPGGPSRWSTSRSSEWQPLSPKLVVEVSYDHFTGGRFRHGTKLLRWRPDKAPEQCTMDQVKQKKANLLKLLE